MRQMMTSISFGFFLIFLSIALGKDVSADIGFTARTQTIVIGWDTKVDARFSSILFNDGVRLVEIQLNHKRFEAILYENGKIDLTGEMIDSMESVRLEESDKFVLKLLNEELARLLDPKIPVEGTLNRFISFLIEFVPVGSRLKALSTTTYVLNDQSIETLCWAIDTGVLVEGTYEIDYRWVLNGYQCAEAANVEILPNGGYRCTEWVEVGPSAPDCLGRCGAGCTYVVPDSGYYQDCLDHDLCAGATGENGGPCREEFNAAVDDYLLGDNCPVNNN